MTNNKTINLLKDMLDITLNLPLFYIEDIKNNLEEIAFIAEASARLIANRASFKLKFDRISKLVKALEMELEGANE